MAGNSAHLPSEREICGAYGVSRITARKALDSLASEGLATREIGRGTFLTNRKGSREIVVYIFTGHREFPQYFQKRIDKFCRSKPGYQMRMEVMKPAQAIVDAFASHKTSILVASHVGFLSALGVLRPLEGIADFPQAVSTMHGNWAEWSTGHDGSRHCYALPFMVMPEVFAFNREYARELGLSEKGPASWDEMLHWSRVAGKLKSKGISATSVQRLSEVPISYYLCASGGRPYLQQHDDTATFNFSHGQQWIDFFRELYNQNLLRLEGRQMSPLITGRTLFEYKAGTWVLHQCKGLPTENKLGICLTPPVNEGMPSFNNVSKWDISIMTCGGDDPKDIETAWEFVRDCCCSEEAQKELLDSFACLSVNREIYGNQQADPLWLPFCQALATGRTRCDHPMQHLMGRHILSKFYSAALQEEDTAHAVESIRK